MIEAIKPLGQVQLGTGATDIYVAGPQPPNAITKIGLWICNTDTAVRAVTIRKGSGTLTAANSVLDAAPLAANHTFFIADGGAITLLAGEKLQGFSDVGAKVTVTAFGAVIT